MNTFEQTLSGNEWLEVLAGGTNLFAKIITGTNFDLYMTTGSAPSPSQNGNVVRNDRDADWEIEFTNLPAGQKVYLRGTGTIIRGIRG